MVKALKLHIALVTTKETSTKKFYTNLIGSDVSFETNEGYSELDTDSPAVIDFESTSVVADLLQKYPNTKFFIRLEVEDALAVYDRCLKEAIPIALPIVTQPYGKKEFYILDPEQNLVQIYQTI